MDKLSDLPPKDGAEMSPQESDVMKKYFDADEPQGKKAKAGWMDSIKVAFYASVLFLALANPWVDTLLCSIPYCGDNALTLLAFKVLLFLILFTGVYKFLVMA